jgi:hypothetical protein
LAVVEGVVLEQCEVRSLAICSSWAAGMFEEWKLRSQVVTKTFSTRKMNVRSLLVCHLGGSCCCCRYCDGLGSVEESPGCFPLRRATSQLYGPLVCLPRCELQRFCCSVSLVGGELQLLYAIIFFGVRVALILSSLTVVTREN